MAISLFYKIYYFHLVIILQKGNHKSLQFKKVFNQSV